MGRINYMSYTNYWDLTDEEKKIPCANCNWLPGKHKSAVCRAAIPPEYGSHKNTWSSLYKYKAAESPWDYATSFLSYWEKLSPFQKEILCIACDKKPGRHFTRGMCRSTNCQTWYMPKK